ncbi:hypothetical protein FIBSPDRAFT_23361 [Athelia psychrophila]|uniref:Uncharacterized protein n=1 Tax=Athelia psychrophila TaxID=1759441 RepID=A0A166GC39_9AGAM|nr:hypothetical protein FIBSPDRAFT_23361 [Fibularhizoctonia sp. CBS 109695]
MLYSSRPGHHSTIRMFNRHLIDGLYGYRGTSPYTIPSAGTRAVYWAIFIQVAYGCVHFYVLERDYC